MGNLREEIDRKLNNVIYLSKEGGERILDNLVNDIEEYQIPGAEDYTDNDIFKTFKYWSMGSTVFPVTLGMIQSEIPNFSKDFVEKVLRRWNLPMWEYVFKTDDMYVPQYTDISILDVGCFMGEYPLKLVREDNNVVGIDVIPSHIEAANFRKKHFLDDKLKKNVKFVEGDFSDAINKPLGKFDIIFINFPSPHSTFAYQSVWYLSICSDHLKPGGEIRLVTELDDIFHRYNNFPPKELRMIRAYETLDCPVDTLLSRSLNARKPDRPFYEIVWIKER